MKPHKFLLILNLTSQNGIVFLDEFRKGVFSELIFFAISKFFFKKSSIQSNFGLFLALNLPNYYLFS